MFALEAFYSRGKPSAGEEEEEGGVSWSVTKSVKQRPHNPTDIP